MNGRTLFETYRAQLALAQSDWGGNCISVFAPGTPGPIVYCEWSDLNSRQKGFWAAVAIEASGFRAYETQPGESVMGIAMRELKDENRWVEILKLNDAEDMSPHDYFGAYHIIRLPKTK